MPIPALKIAKKIDRQGAFVVRPAKTATTSLQWQSALKAVELPGPHGNTSAALEMAAGILCAIFYYPGENFLLVSHWARATIIQHTQRMVDVSPMQVERMVEGRLQHLLLPGPAVKPGILPVVSL